MKIKHILLTILPFFLLSGCKKKENISSSLPISSEQISLTLNYPSVTLSEEKTCQLKAYLDGNEISDATYSVKDSTIASVSETGLIKAIKIGTTQVYATFNEDVAVCEVEVTHFEPDATLSTSYTQTEFSLYVGTEYTLPLTVRFGKKTILNYDFTYTPNDSDIAKIEQGKIKGLKSGSVSFIATVTYEEKSVEDILKVTIY